MRSGILRQRSTLDLFNEYLYEYLSADVPNYQEVIDLLDAHRGKQLRARLSLLCAELGGPLSMKSYRAALFVEMLHTGTLVHDDIVDESAERRGAPSVNAKWGKRVALYSGNMIGIKALILATENEDNDLIKIYGTAIDQIVKSELLQLKKSFRFRTSEKTYFEIINGKTAALFKAACKAGATTTMKNLQQAERIGQLGEYVGLAFQIKDDLFGYQTLDVGKPLDNDFKERKMTLPLIHALRNTNWKQRFTIKRVLKKRDFTKEDHKWIVKQVISLGGVAYAEKTMCDYCDKAIEILNQFGPSDAKAELLSIINYVTERKY